MAVSPATQLRRRAQAKGLSDKDLVTLCQFRSRGRTTEPAELTHEEWIDAMADIDWAVNLPGWLAEKRTAAS